MKAISRTRRSAVTVIAGMIAVGGLAFASPASAQDNVPNPEGTAGCTYAGSSCSNGSTRQQVKNRSNGTFVYENYECKNGSWVYTGTSRKAPVFPQKLPPVGRG